MNLRYLRFTFLLLFLEENSCSKKKYYKCTYHKELFFELFDKRESEEMICWDSQLHDSTRLFLTQKYNDYRREVARGTCPSCSIREKYQYMCEMKWHWILEKKAQTILQTRNLTQQMASLSLNEVLSADTNKLGYRFLQTKYLEYVTTSFLLDKLVDVGQLSYVSRFLIYLNTTNILYDWSKVNKAEPSTYTAFNEQIEDGDRILSMACVFASPIQHDSTDTYNELYNQVPTTESCSMISRSTLVAVDVKNDLCSFSDESDAMAIFTPCQIYYPHPHFVDVCSEDVPDYWNDYQLLKDSNYSEILMHMADGAKLKLTFASVEKKLPSSARPLVIENPHEAFVPSATNSVDGLDLGDGNLELNRMDDSSFEWPSERKDRDVESSTEPFLLFEPQYWPPTFVNAPLPANPEEETVFLSAIPVVNPYDAKYCVVLTLFYFIVLLTLCVLLSIVAKYYVEREYFKSLK